MKAQPKTAVPLTAADRVMELAGWAALLALWALTLYYYPRLPEIIPIHYNAAGEPDDHGRKVALLLLPVVATVLSIGMTVLNRFPHLFNYPTAITPENAERQYRGATRLIRFLKLAVILVFTMIVYKTIRTATGGASGLGVLFLPLVVALFLLPLSIFAIRSFLDRPAAGK